jgi:4-amino-4-deoxy-L-arabinose transferase-like glycosyltransferase
VRQYPRADDTYVEVPTLAGPRGGSTQGVSESSRRRWMFWRSPSDQPGWARPLLLGITALGALTYLWGISDSPLEPYYAAAARSMGSNWHDFFFGAFDPRGTITLDKLPGAFWIQGLFVRVLGFHYWVVAFPQVIAGVLTILVLYRTLRRVAGPEAGLLAALLLAASPATVLLNRGNVSDPWLVLFTVLAADAAVRAMTSDRRSTLVVAGLWVGLAFQTKMIQAWLILPVLFGAYLFAGQAQLRRRIGTVLLAGVVAVVVSLSWMTVVTLVPGHDRPFVDGTSNNSAYAQVFVYNGWSRIGIPWDHSDLVKGHEPFLTVAIGPAAKLAASAVPAGWRRLLAGPLGRDDGWLLPATVISLIGLMVARRRSARTDILRASAMLWGAWLLLLFAFFSAGSLVNAYYLGALAPAEAALCALGAVTVWRERRDRLWTSYVLIATVLASVPYAVYLVGSARGYTNAVTVCCIAIGAIAVLGLAGMRWTRWPTGRNRDAANIVVTAVALLFVPVVAVATSVSADLGAFSTPFQPATVTTILTTSAQFFQSHGATVARTFSGPMFDDPIAQVDDTANSAAPLIMVTGREFLPLGGYLGTLPVPTLSELKHLVKTHQVIEFVVPITPPGSDPRTAWVRRSCRRIYATRSSHGVDIGTYDCDESP